jgi:broad specificity polyphosphatase/5'/3'-nucleotidase SurE
LPCANDARGNWEIIYVTKKEDDGSTSRALMALATAVADQNYWDAEIIVAAPAREHGVRMPEAES